MDTLPHGEQRYSANQAEQDILTKEITQYFKNAKRSNERKDIAAETAQKLAAVNPSHGWDEKKVRVWFRNNRDRFVDQSEINSEFTEKKQARVARATVPLSRSSVSVEGGIIPRLEIPVPGNRSAASDSVSDRVRPPIVQFVPDDPAFFPGVPTVEQVQQNGSEEVYKTLRKYARVVQNAASSLPQIRKQKQPEIELRFVETLSRFQTPLEIAVPHHVDVATTIVEGGEKAGLGGSSFNFVTGRIPSTVMLGNIRALYSGQIAPGGIQRIRLDSIYGYLADVGEDPVEIYYDRGQQSYNVGVGHMHVYTGFWFAPTAITIANKTIWIAGDNRVKGFDRDTLTNIVTLHVREEVVKKSSVAVLEGFLVLAVDSVVYCWDAPTRPIEGEKKFNPAEVIAQEGVIEVDDSTVDPGVGREPSTIKTIRLGEGVSIDTICAIDGKWLAVASSEYPVIHIFDKGLNLISRLIGHTMGITCLFAFKERLFSGSIDRTIKSWDVETGHLDFAYHGHTEKVTCLYLSSGPETEVFLFSGSDNKTVRAWDVGRKRAVFEMVVDSEVAPKVLNFVPELNELKVLTWAPDRTEAEVHMYRFA